MPDPPEHPVTYSEACVELVKRAEGFREEPYVCPGGILTIGFGTTRNAIPGIKVSREFAEVLLREDLDAALADVRRLVKAPLTQGQLDALVSFVHNLGAGAFGGSTMLRYINGKAYTNAAEEFGKWVHSKGRKLPGLVTRRADERALFLS